MGSDKKPVRRGRGRTQTATPLSRHPLLSQDAKDACAVIDAIRARRTVDLLQYLCPQDERKKQVLNSIGVDELIKTGVDEAKSSLAKEESRLSALIEDGNANKTDIGELQNLLELVTAAKKSCRTVINQLRPRISTLHLDKRCTSDGFEPPHLWLERIGVERLLLNAADIRAGKEQKKVRRWFNRVVMVFKMDRLSLQALERAIVSATRLMRLADKANLEYCFLQLELCRMMCQLLVVCAVDPGGSGSSSSNTASTLETKRRVLWDPANIPTLYPQLRFHDNHASVRVYSLFGYLFDNPRDCDPQPAEDRVAQLFKKAIPHKHQPHHFLPVTATWACEDGYNPVRKLLIEIMTFFWLGVYPHCSRKSRLTRDDDLLYLYSTRGNAEYVDVRRVVDELHAVSGLHAVKEYLNSRLCNASALAMAGLSDAWPGYEQGVNSACEELRKARLAGPLDRPRLEERAFKNMLTARSQMTAIGASVRVPGNFLVYINRRKGKEWDDNVLSLNSKTPDIDQTVRTILDAPDVSFCRPVTSFIFQDKAIDELAQSQPFCVRVTRELADFRERDRMCMVRLLTVLCVWFRVGYADFCHIRSIVDVYYAGTRGSSSFPEQFDRHFKDRPHLKAVVAAMAFLWVNLTAVTYVRLPANLSAHVDEAMLRRSISLVGDDTLAKSDNFWLCLYCGVCNCSHSLVNAYPKIGGAEVRSYHGHADAGFGRGLRVDLLSGQADCDRTGSRIAFQCASSHCLSLSMKGCVVNWSRARGFICSCCGILAIWCPVFGSSWKKGYLCARCSVIDPDKLEAIATGLRLARGGPSGSLRLKQTNRRNP